MESETIFLNETDTKELRKELGLPLTKRLIYWNKNEGLWEKCNLTDYEILETLQPSESCIIKITLESGKQVNILSEYLSEMQKTSFLKDIGENENENAR